MTLLRHWITKSTERKRAAMLLVVLVGVGIFGTVAFVIAADKPGITLIASPTTQTLTEGQPGAVNYMASVTRSGGFAGSVVLTVDGLPSNVTAKWANGSTTYT